MTKYSGSCLCQKVKYEVEGTFDLFYLCHCKHCQKDTGSAHAANLFSTNAKLKWLSGGSAVKNFNLPGTRHAKSFCAECSSALPNLQMNGQLLVVPAGSIDEDISTKPTAHIFCSSKANWEDALAITKQFERLPTEES